MSALEPGSLAGVDTAEWDALADRVGASPFLRPGWFHAWWRAFGAGTLEVLTVRRAGRLAAVLPLVRRGRALRAPANAESPEFGFVAEDDASARELAEVVLWYRTTTRLDLAPLNAGDADVRSLLENAALGRRRLLLSPALRAPYVPLEGSWQEYESRRDARRRRELRRRRRRLEELGPLRLELHERPEDLPATLAEGLRLEASGWKAAQGTAINSAAATVRFYHDVADWAMRRGWLRLAFLRLGDRALAFDFCFEANATHYLLKTGYAPEFSQYGPGMLLRSMMIERAFSEGLATYEFLGTAEGDNNRWKLDWADRFHERVRVQVFARSLPATVQWAARKMGPPLLQRVRAQAKRTLGSSGRHAARRARHLLRSALQR